MKNILHVEDDKNIVLLVRAVLEKAGYHVVSAQDAMQGLMMARQNPPDLMILDIMMPAGGGASVYERMRGMTPTAHVPVLIYSASAPEEIQKKLVVGPNTTFLQKPAPPAEIISAVKALLNEKP